MSNNLIEEHNVKDIDLRAFYHVLSLIKWVIIHPNFPKVTQFSGCVQYLFFRECDGL